MFSFLCFGTQSYAVYKVEKSLKLLRQSTRSLTWVGLFILYTEMLLIENSELTANTLYNSIVIFSS